MIGDRIESARTGLITRGITPEQLWLGPSETIQFQEHLKQLWSDPFNTPQINSHSDGVIRFRGLLVRFSSKDGVQVTGKYCEA